MGARTLRVSGGAHLLALSQPEARCRRPRATRSGNCGKRAQEGQAVYELPFQAHATMEPMNTTVDVRDGLVEMWTPTQWAGVTQADIVRLSGLPKEKVIVHMMLSGGSFGRRGQWDFPAEAWQIGSVVRKPLQLVWTREDDMQHDFYRQYSYHRMTGAVDEGGKLLAWWHRVVSTSIRQIFDPPERLKDPRRVAAQELGAPTSFLTLRRIFRLDYNPVHSAVPRMPGGARSGEFVHDIRPGMLY